MSSREKIINAIRQNKPEDRALPSLQLHMEEQHDLLSRFQTALGTIGGHSWEVNSYEEISAWLSDQQPQNGYSINAVPQLAGCTIQEFKNASARELEATTLFIVKGKLAVAENGAVWICEKNMGNRLLPFLCRQLVIVVEETTLVPTMHEAYQQLIIDQEGYGVFIAGPSKTADIEQSLVIGAHGPLGLQVFIVRN